MESVEGVHPVARFRVPLLIEQSISQIHSLPAEIIKDIHF
jgi:hypothetical protein